ncbi:MAG: TolC family protein [Acidobacteriota bacterium]
MKKLALVLALVATAHAEVAPQKLTLRGAIELALGRNPEIVLAERTVEGATARTSGAKAHRLPSVRVDFAGNFYTKPYQLDFGGALFTLYERETTFTNVVVSQPLTGLAYLSELVGAAEHETNASRQEYDKTRLDVAYKTADAYIHALEARASADVAHRSVADIDSGLQRAIQLRQAETYTDIDVLRFRSAKAAAEQAALHADTQSQEAVAGLTLQMGLRDGTPIEIADDLPPDAPRLVMTLEQAQQRALQARPELRAAHERLAAANATRVSRREQYLPDIRAIGEWDHATGVQPFQPSNQEFLGLRLSWNVWDWGATHQAVREAEAAQSKAEIESEALVEVVKLDVRKRWLDAKTAFDSLAAAATQQQAAEEAYRLQKVRFDAGAATTTDVLDAETDVARARLAALVARYDYYLKMVALARAIGDLPSTQL